MATRRQQRLNELLLEEISLLVPGQFDDPRLTSVRVTRVETAQDLSTAKVYVTRLDSDQPEDDPLPALQHAAGRLRDELAAMGLRRLPRLVFALDTAFESGERVLRLLDRLDAAEDALALSEPEPNAVTAPDGGEPEHPSG